LSIGGGFAYYAFTNNADNLIANDLNGIYRGIVKYPNTAGKKHLSITIEVESNTENTASIIYDSALELPNGNRLVGKGTVNLLEKTIDFENGLLGEGTIEKIVINEQAHINIRSIELKKWWLNKSQQKINVE